VVVVVIVALVVVLILQLLLSEPDCYTVIDELIDLTTIEQNIY